MGAVKAELGRLLGYEHVVLFGRARSALVAVIEETVHAGGPVIIPSNACSALLAAVLAAGRVPVVASVSAENGLVADEAFAATINGWTDMPGLVLATHLYGMVADYPATVAAAKQKGWQLFENDSMASRAFLPDRTALGQGLVVSFGHGKPLDGGGGGALLTNDGALASALTRRVSAWPVFDAAADAVENHVVLARRHLYALGVPSATEPLLPIEAAHCRHAYDEAWCDGLTHAISTFQDANSRKVERLDAWHSALASARDVIAAPQPGIRSAWRAIFKVRDGSLRDRIVARLRGGGFDAGTNYPPLWDSAPNLIGDQRAPGGDAWGATVLSLWLSDAYDAARIKAGAALIRQTIEEVVT